MKKSDDTRRRILDASAKMFRRKGYDTTTLKDIAKIVKVRAPAIYYYFDSKEQLLEEILNIGIDRIHDAVLDAVTEPAAEASHRERIEAAIQAHLTTLLRHSDYTAANIINYHLAPKKIRKRHLIRRERYNDCWRLLLQEAQQAGEIEASVDLHHLRLFLLSALFWTHEWYRTEDEPIEAMAKRISGVLFDGIGGTKAK
ncbi:MAG: TetR/AcrR family transcriptional regulator [Alphaproteobacteria bacterium]|jgi:AcrR family transcriptional regulator|nr:TetR/AcrR family transcriptional regulator [Alphaproteobacteria bacterium]MDP6257204.1 TetR/AcrR family transcriptional regulator [Alphaproteobacteria bacterium]MDP7459751.1 TetR/AcrR family transcriptional regulator [Alphaproteobacteria bacterium]|tara:strand:- start:1177 stop:1773 length:597 start_codon:yes stop_codon:yes gene_type:complete